MFVNRQYLNDLFMLRCTPDIIALRVFPNAKEWTESMAVWNGAVRAVGGSEQIATEPTAAVVVGDGRRPRTGVLMAYRTPWTVISVDPRVDTTGKWTDTQRLVLIPARFEDAEEAIRQHLPDDLARLVYILPHSHMRKPFPLWALKLAPWVAAVAMPCCVPTYPIVFAEMPDYTYIDKGCLSPRREIEIWWLRGKHPARAKSRRGQYFAVE